MNRPDLFEAFVERMRQEREYQSKKWGDEFDKKNTPNDWCAYIAGYVGKAVTLPWNPEAFGTALIKAATLCAAAHEWLWRTEGNMPKRHYDGDDAPKIEAPPTPGDVAADMVAAIMPPPIDIANPLTAYQQGVVDGLAGSQPAKDDPEYKEGYAQGHASQANLTGFTAIDPGAGKSEPVVVVMDVSNSLGVKGKLTPAEPLTGLNNQRVPYSLDDPH